MESYMTIAGTIITCIGTGVTLWQASAVRTYSKQIALDLRKIYLSETSENLKRAQDEGRILLTQVQQLVRGRSGTQTANSIQGHIDKALNCLHLNGPDHDIRALIVSAQVKLRESQNSSNSESRTVCVSDMHAKIQDAISLCKERMSNLNTGAQNV